MDESGIALGACANSIRLGDALKKKTLIQSPEDRKWVSIVEAISALDQSIWPLVIFKGKHIQSTWFHYNKVPNWIYTTSKNSWIANHIAFNWLTKIFLPKTKPSGNEAWLLILDSYGSHYTTEFLWECKANNVWLVFLPPYLTHVLQPLDLLCFCPIKTKYWEQIAELACIDNAAPIKKHCFIKYYYKARGEGLTARTIKSEWCASGIYPWNSCKGLESLQVKKKTLIGVSGFKQSKIN